MFSETTIETTRAKPFLRWTGSKNWFIKEECRRFIPARYNNYHEPFLGGGAVFFGLNQPNQVFLNDLNWELVNTYVQIRDNLELVISALKRYVNSREDYYRVREMQCRANYSKAAKFIYLNRTSFNGIYRVNWRGVYNVPYGKRPNVDIVTENNLREVNKKLQKATLSSEDFYNTLQHIQKGDLVYLDPPYTVAHEHNGFIEYNSKLFSWEDQLKLVEYIQEVKRKKAFFILSNAEHFEVRKLYHNIGKIVSLSRYCRVGGRNKTRGMYREIIVTNSTI